MPTINIIDNNRNMTGVAPSGGCGGGGGGGYGGGGMPGVPFQAAMSPQGAVMNSLGCPCAGMGMMGGGMMGGGPMGGMGNSGAGQQMGALSFPNFMMAQTEENQEAQQAC
mmetsp:Transcript_32940/g.40743  ORF Transcript_32940/g.40743 Transcript_32940/m.40743 type:complete len:110 (+) Transcript_32940:187-516(+)|eukprot:CAMPEP_0170468004 /NCGR_PEP_ID=MMETSP0123-20130129/11356_1 /TAXON_ID=182087 /ORGANISM="Favella ehrenbergii, Strain Fehren 1" /LENGTH=109 /DNA_ID=CAMNT_0010734483 /DNA_START=189 /DNA_END=518 /DNA_ORIENTATION=+